MQIYMILMGESSLKNKLATKIPLLLSVRRINVKAWSVANVANKILLLFIRNSLLYRESRWNIYVKELSNFSKAFKYLECSVTGACWRVGSCIILHMEFATLLATSELLILYPFRLGFFISDDVFIVAAAFLGGFSNHHLHTVTV